MFPLTIPLTTGPGTISVAVALGAGHPKLFAGLGWFFLGMTAAAVAMAATIWVTYHYADRLTRDDGTHREPHDHSNFRLPAVVHRRADPDHRDRGRARAAAGGTHLVVRSRQKHPMRSGELAHTIKD